ncbi:MAG TPA: VOC family protein [Gaiellaceae bacterium]|nr:VOC family protein [Gaiellaceae bacterium]
MSASIDHVTLRCSDLDASLRLFTQVFELLEFRDRRHDGGGFHEWHDLSIASADDANPATRRLHVGLAASSCAQVDDWWRELTAAGYRDDGAPGPRPEYSPEYYGAFIRDNDDNSIEAVHHARSDPSSGVIDHLWIRVRDLAATRRFYAAVAQALGLRVPERSDRFHVVTDTGTFTLLEADEATRGLHLALGVGDAETVQAFHAAGLGAGGVDNGAPGERPVYHAGYYAAYLRDPDANNIEAVWHNRADGRA